MELAGLQFVAAGASPGGETWFAVDGLPEPPGGYRTACAVYCRPRVRDRFHDVLPAFQVSLTPTLFLPRDADRPAEEQQAAIYAAVADYLEQLAFAFHVAAVETSNG